MQADALVVLALMAGFVVMLGVGVWAHLEDETRDVIVALKGRVVAGVSAAVGVLLLLAAA